MTTTSKHIPMELLREAARELAAEHGVLWSADAAIAGLVQIARSPHLTDAERADARHEILLVLGAIDGYIDRRGDTRISMREKQRLDRAAGLN